MPWEKQFDVDQALDRVMRLFWHRGYDATSMQELVEATGVNRGSMYDTFGDKHTLFVEALRRYEGNVKDRWLEVLTDTGSPRRAILAVFEDAACAGRSDRSRSGCFLMNTAMGLAPHDQEIGQVVSKSLKGVERFFRDMIIQGQDAGEIPAHVDAAQAAQVLLGLLAGLRVMARSRPEGRLLGTLAAQAEAVLS